MDSNTTHYNKGVSMLVCDLCNEPTKVDDKIPSSGFISFAVPGEADAVYHISCILKNLKVTRDSRITELRLTHRNPGI